MASELATMISIIYESDGFEVLGKLSKMTGDLLAGTNDLSKSIGTLKTNVAGLASSLTDLGTTARGAGAAARSSAAGIASVGVAARAARAEIEALTASYAGARSAMSGAGLAAAIGPVAAAGSAAGAAAAAARSAAPRTAQAESVAASLALPAGSPRALAANVGSLATIPPGVNRAFPIPGTGGPVGGGGGSGSGSGGVGGGSGRGGGRSGGFAPLPIGGLPGAIGQTALHSAMIAADVGLGYAADGVYEAGKLQTLMFGVKNSTGATNAQIRKLQQSAYDVGDLTGLSAVEAAKGMVNIARSSGGVFRTKSGGFDMAGLNAIIPTVLEAAQIQHITRGTPVDESATSMMETVHLFRASSGTPFKKLADDLTRLSEMMPTSLKTANRQFTYFEPTFKSMGISDMDAMSSFAMLARAGYGQGKGGTNLQDLVAAALPALELTRHAQTGKAGLLRKYGFMDAKGNSEFFTDNKADLMGFYAHLADLGKEYGRTELTESFRSMFGIQGSRIANLARDPWIAQQIPAIEAIMKDPRLSLQEQFKGYQGQFGFQAERSAKNFQSLAGEIGSLALPGLTKGFMDLGNQMHSAQVWLHQHGALELQIQRDITGAVKGTEQWIVSHNKDWENLRHDLVLTYNAGKELAPMLGAVASGLTMAASGLTAFIGPLTTIVDTVAWFNGQGNKPGSTLNDRMKTDYFGRQVTVDDGGNGPNPRLPRTRAQLQRANARWTGTDDFGPSTVHHHYHVTQTFNGPAHPRAVAAAVHALKNYTGSTSGSIVTRSNVPAPLTVTVK
jgi:hypothetical protein